MKRKQGGQQLISYEAAQIKKSCRHRLVQYRIPAKAKQLPELQFF